MEIYFIIFCDFGPSDLSIELTMRGAEESLVVIVLSGSPRVKASMKQRHPCNILPNQLVPCASQQDGDWCGLQSHYVVLEVPSSPWHEAIYGSYGSYGNYGYGLQPREDKKMRWAHPHLQKHESRI